MKRDDRGSARHVAVALHIDKNFFQRHLKAFCHGLKNSHVGLMGNQALDVLKSKARLGQQVFDRQFHGPDRNFKNFRALHFQAMHTVLDRFQCGRHRRSACGNFKQVPLRPVASADDGDPIDVADRTEYLKDEGGIGLCNITKCCTEVCPEDIHITDNAIIPLKERVADEYYDPFRWIFGKLRRR